MSDKASNPATNAPTGPAQPMPVAVQNNGHGRIQLAVGGERVSVLRSGNWKVDGTWTEGTPNPVLAKALSTMAREAEKEGRQRLSAWMAARGGGPLNVWRNQHGGELFSLQTKNGKVFVHLTLPGDSGSRTVSVGTIEPVVAQALAAQLSAPPAKKP